MDIHEFTKSVSQRFDVNDVAYLFYGLCYFDQCKFKNIESKMALKSSLEIIDQLALIFKDYLTLLIGGEVRHATARIYSSHIKFKDNALTDHTARNTAYRLITYYRVKSVVTTCKGLFSKVWEDGFGGKRWKIISTTLEEYLKGKLTPKQFVDKCFFIVHNGNMLFTKAIIFKGNEHQLRNWLEQKNTGQLDDEFERIKLFGFLTKVNSLMKDIRKYTPIEWGRGNLKYESKRDGSIRSQ